MNGMTGPTEFGFLREVASPHMGEDQHIITYPYEIKCDLGIRECYDTSVLPADLKEWVDAHIQQDYDSVVVHLGPRLEPGKTFAILWLSDPEDAVVAKLAWHE